MSGEGLTRFIVIIECGKITPVKKEIERLGILGGTFSPPTKIGHLEIAIACLRQGVVDQVVLMPVFAHTEKEMTVDYRHRLMMTRLLIAELSTEFVGRIVVSTLEAFLPRPNKTCVTLAVLAEQTGKQVKLIVGGDNASLRGWHEREEILGRGVIMVPRGGTSATQQLPRGVYRLPIPPIEGSSTMARACANNTDQFARITGMQVMHYAFDNNLYATK